MAVKIRCKRMGNKNRPFFRVVVADSRFQRDGRFLEILGHYDPLRDPAVVEINRELTLKWLERGAQISETAKSLLKKTGIYQEYQQKLADARKKKKESTGTMEAAPEILEDSADSSAVQQEISPETEDETTT